MTRITALYHHLNAFTKIPFAGNPAAVVTLSPADSHVFESDELLGKLAAELNQPATAFYIKHEDNPVVSIKWFYPYKRIPVCGHGTLAASHVLFQNGWQGDKIEYDAGPAGKLVASRAADGSITLDFPASELVPLQQASEALSKLGGSVTKALSDSLHPKAAVPFEIVGRGDRGGYVDMVVVRLPDDFDLKGMAYDPTPLQELSADIRGIILTARSNSDPNADFHSRAIHTDMKAGEDSVTGSSHCMLGPYWTRELGLDAGQALRATQVSARGGSMSVLWKRAEMRCLLTSTAVILGKGELDFTF